VVVLALDDGRRVRLANDAAARLLGKPAGALVGATGESLGLAEVLQGDAPRIVQGMLPGGPWELRRGAFRLSGEPHTLVVLSDVGTALRENEREAWRKVIRVMGHEINNSLSPIRSISEGLLAELAKSTRAPDWETDLARGLEVVARRSEALARFMASYAKLARLPPPRLQPVHLPSVVKKIAALEQRMTVEVVPGPDLELRADVDQLEQVLINLVKNAVDASLPTAGRVSVRWAADDRGVAIAVEDEGPGVGDTANLFVPFFTTKPDGSGIGLVLSRQIVEAHRGQLSLASRQGDRGAVALIRLPA
jgi:nitrogen fixation/metabolism regulation signal transduction histidine kinase